MLNYGSWLLQGYSIILNSWDPKISLANVSADTFPLWVQVHGLPKNFYNEKIAKFLGNSLGKFICYDSRSLYNEYGLRFKIYLSKKGFDYSKLNILLLDNGEIRKIPLLLEQVGRLCPSCLTLEHIAQHCHSSSPSQFQATVSVVGLKSVRVEFDDFFGCYISYFQEKGIKFDFELSRQINKRKFDSLEEEVHVSKRP